MDAAQFKTFMKEVKAIKRLLMLQLTAQDFSRTKIGKAVGVTRASDVRKLIPKIKPKRRDRKTAKKKR
jgi:hypothetical protein